MFCTTSQVNTVLIVTKKYLISTINTDTPIDTFDQASINFNFQFLIYSEGK